MHIKFDKTYINNSGFSVAMVVANAVAGDSRVIKTAGTLSKLGFRVHLFGMSKTENGQMVEGYPFPIELVGNPAYQMKAERQWLDTDGKRNLPLFIDLLAQKICASMGNRSFDILHTHDMYGLPVGTALKKLVDSKFVGWVHDLHEFVEGCTNIDEHIRTGMLRFEETYIREPNALTTVSPILARMLAENYSIPEPSLVLNTPRLADFDPFYSKPIRTALQLDAKKPLIVYNGNVKPERGVHLAVEALEYLPEIHLALITNSKGDYVEHIHKIARRIGASNRLHLHPYVPNCEVTSFLRGVDAGINPVSLYANSDLALPNKVFEYIHSGIPVVSTKTTALAHFLKENNCGVTFPENDVRALAKAIQLTLSTYRNTLPDVAQGSQLASIFSWETQEEVIAGVYRRLLNNHSKSGKKPLCHSIEPIIHLPKLSANQPFTIAKGLREHGFNAVSAALTTSKFGYECDQIIERQKHSLDSIDSYLSQQELGKYTTYHYHSRPLIYHGDFSFPTGFDLVLLKAMGKAVFFHFRGSEARRNSVFKAATPHHYVVEKKVENERSMPFFFDEAKQLAFRDFISGVCDEVFVTDPELQCYVPNALIVPRAIDGRRDSPMQGGKERSIPLIVHAPSSRGVKGTEAILHTVEELRNKGYLFDFQLVENLPHQEAFSIYEQADIIIDQLRIGWYGVLAVEGMALGKAVVSYIRSDLRHYLPFPSPIAVATPDNLGSVLGYLLDNPDEVLQYGEKGKKFVSEYHDAQSIAKLLVDIYSRPVRTIDPVAVCTFLNQKGITPGPFISTKLLTAKLRKGYAKRRKRIVKHFRKFFMVLQEQGVMTATTKSIREIRKIFWGRGQ